MLDIMGDIGGLFLSLRVISSILLLILNFDGHLVFIMSQMIDLTFERISNKNQT